MVRGIQPFVTGRRIVAVRRCRCRLRPILIEPGVLSISARARGRTITAVRRIAKRIVLDLDSGDAFVIEPRMTGLMLLSDPPSRKHLRFEWEFAPQHPGCSKQPECFERLWFWDRRGLGTLRLYTADELRGRLSPPHLGPDALSITPGQWRVALSRTKRAIKVALLDQKLVAGIGNLYASEILHLSGIHPETSADCLRKQSIHRLFEATRSVLETAILHEGSTLSDGTYRNVLNQDGSYQNQHRVYDHAGEQCPSCDRSTIRRIVQAQRSTYFCPRCQRKQPSSSA